MKFRITIILFAAMIAAGCGTWRKVSQSTTRQSDCLPQEENREEPRRERDRDRDRQTNERQNTGRMAADARAEPPVNRIPRPALRFSDTETQHVSLSAINYFPSGGIDVSLDELTQEFCYPLCGKLISDYGMRNGRMHTGIDIKAAPGDTIRAAFAGVVRMSKNYSGYGNIVVVRHYHGFETVYSHNSKNLVKPNDPVEAGDPIALAGRTGRATTEHLHFEVRAGGSHLDPKLFVDPQGMTLRGGNIFIRNNNGAVAASTSEPGAVQAGEEILMARAEYETARAEALAQSTVDGKPKAPAQPEPVYYRVQKNDTLSGIARRHNTTVSKLCELNRIKSTSLLQINQRLRVK